MPPEEEIKAAERLPDTGMIIIGNHSVPIGACRVQIPILSIAVTGMAYHFRHLSG
jgi:hypothetical protein